MELTGYQQQIKSKVNHVYVTKDGFRRTKRNNQEERTQRAMALGVGAVMGGGASPWEGGRAGALGDGSEAAVRLVCVEGVEAPGHKEPRAMLRTSRPPGPEPFHFLHVLTSLGFLCRM